MKTENSIYRCLQEHMDNMPIGFPKSESGLDIKLLKHLFNEQEAVIALELNAIPEPIEKIYKRVKQKGISIEELERILDGLVEKGAILDAKHFMKNNKRKQYSKVPLAIGMFEFQVGRLTKEYYQDFREYSEEVFHKAIHSKKTSQMRTIPINESITSDHKVSTYDTAREIVNNTTGTMAVLNCVCREGKDLVSDPCKRGDIRETCLIFEESAKLLLDMKRGREINRQEALVILDKAEESGLVLQPSNSKKPHFICCCCGCCCEAIQAMKLFPKPAEYCHSNYQSEIDIEKCTGCKSCAKICPMDAITINNKIAAVNYDRCIGCGVCVPKCKFDAVFMKTTKVPYVPPKDHQAMYNKILFERIGPFGMLKTVSKALLGMKI